MVWHSSFWQSTLPLEFQNGSVDLVFLTNFHPLAPRRRGNRFTLGVWIFGKAFPRKGGQGVDRLTRSPIEAPP